MKHLFKKYGVTTHQQRAFRMLYECYDAGHISTGQFEILFWVYASKYVINRVQIAYPAAMHLTNLKPCEN